MERITFSRKSLNGQRPRVDRFVPPRDSITNTRTRGCWRQLCDLQNDDIWHSKYLQRKKYIKYLDEALGLEPAKESRMLEEIQPWPCTPRKKRYLCSADSVLDLPTYGYAPFPELLDWSNDNILVAALGRNYHKWSWRTQSLISQGNTQHEIQCCKFDPRGDLLILGTDTKTVEIHDSQSKKIDSNCCRCLMEDGESCCSITAVDWSPTGNAFVTGCLRGMIVSFSRVAVRISWRRPMQEPIILLRVSPDARYVAAISTNSQEVLVMTWPFLVISSRVGAEWTAKTIAWHPWRSALLGVGAVMPDLYAKVAFWDVPTSRVQETSISRKRYSLDAMLFSHITGELVLSLWEADSAFSLWKSSTKLVVMSDPETVVDQWGEGRTGLDRVRTMVFSPDGTKLATATSGEDLIIWNFLPEDKKKKSNRKKFFEIPVFLDSTTDGVSLR